VYCSATGPKVTGPSYQGLKPFETVIPNEPFLLQVDFSQEFVIVPEKLTNRLIFKGIGVHEKDKHHQRFF
jgi:hypothetical protein